MRAAVRTERAAAPTGPPEHKAAPHRQAGRQRVAEPAGRDEHGPPRAGTETARPRVPASRCKPLSAMIVPTVEYKTTENKRSLRPFECDTPDRRSQIAKAEAKPVPLHSRTDGGDYTLCTQWHTYVVNQLDDRGQAQTIGRVVSLARESKLAKAGLTAAGSPERGRIRPSEICEGVHPVVPH